jgi:MinD superfamily P-loop ATPase
MNEISRRDFFKSFPREVLKGFKSIQRVERKPHLDVSRCLAWGGMSCQSCYLACHLRDQAIVMIDTKPVIYQNACDGCGACLEACRIVNDPPSIAMVEGQ